MLKVLKTSSVIKEKIKSDKYIPLKVVWKEFESYPEALIYWRRMDLRHSLLEIGISKKSGIIRSLTLVSAINISFTSAERLSYGRIKEGTPIFNIKKDYIKNVVNDVGMLKVHYFNEHLDIIISDNHINEGIISGRVLFGLDSNMNICKISVCNLSCEERFQIRDTLQYMIQINEQI